MTVSALLSNNRFKKWAVLEYGYTTDDLQDLCVEHLHKLMLEWQDAPDAFCGAVGKAKEDKSLTTGKKGENNESTCFIQRRR